jgi:hypothetical protein
MSASSNQGENSVALGYQCGEGQTGKNCVAIGYRAGKVQYDNCIHIGVNESSILNEQGANSIVVGNTNTFVHQCNESINFGNSNYISSEKSVLFGSGNTTGRNESVTFGNYIVSNSDNSIIFGNYIEGNSGNAGSIILNANSGAFNAESNGFFVAPVNKSAASNILCYDRNTNQICKSDYVFFNEIANGNTDTGVYKSGENVISINTGYTEKFRVCDKLSEFNNRVLYKKQIIYDYTILNTAGIIEIDYLTSTYIYIVNNDNIKIKLPAFEKHTDGCCFKFICNFNAVLQTGDSSNLSYSSNENSSLINMKKSHVYELYAVKPNYEEPGYWYLHQARNFS